MPSIRQNAYPDLLPDFRNLAVMARVLVGVNALALAGAFYASPALGPAFERFIRAAAFLEPLLLVELMALFAAAAFLLAYFRLHTKAFSPALAEARLQALQARIRPHFLFNSLNAVLALIRRDPKRAERSLEDLADLFRTLMADARQFVRLADEIALLERYA